MLALVMLWAYLSFSQFLIIWSGNLPEEIGWYLNRRDGVPGWQVASSMLFIMLCEPLYLLLWAALGVQLTWDRLPAIFHWVPTIAAAARRPRCATQPRR